jgi:hypothetical protein
MTDETKEGFVKLKMPTYYIAKHSDEDLQAAVLAEREACAEIARFARMHSIADAIMKRGRNMSTKPKKIDTSEERVHETDKSIHDDDDIQEYKRPWVGLTDEEINDFDKKLRDHNDYCSLHFAWGISAKLRERNT